MANILVIDDDESIQTFFRETFRDAESSVVGTTIAAQAESLFRCSSPDVALIDVHLGEESGLKLIAKLHAIDPRVPIIVMTGQGTAAIAIEAMSLGAYDYLLKPFKVQQLRGIVQRAGEVGQSMRTPALKVDGATPALAPPPQSGLLIGECGAIQEVFKSIGRVAKQDVSVLILGESGTGKELVARAIYQFSRRSQGPFLAINCAAIPETLLESELFGHEKGAFTGAERKRIGRFEQCSGGTLFLDEIGDMSPLTQTKILRLLQEQRFERVGGTETIQTDVRVIAATNCDLQKLVETGDFREDLYYRINGFEIRLPPLRERKEDIPRLCQHFVRIFAEEMGKEVSEIDPETMAMLCNYAWPGNIRELQSVLKQAILHATAPRLVPQFLPTILTGKSLKKTIIGPGASNDLDRWLDSRLADGAADLHREWQSVTDCILLAKVLEKTAGNVSRAARTLGIDRGTLRAKLNALGLVPGVDETS